MKDREHDPRYVEGQRAQGKLFVQQQYAETLHEANAVLRQPQLYDPADVVTQTRVRDTIYKHCAPFLLSPLEVDRISEDEWNRRMEELREQERAGEFAS